MTEIRNRTTDSSAATHYTQTCASNIYPTYTHNMHLLFPSLTSITQPHLPWVALESQSYKKEFNSLVVFMAPFCQLKALSRQQKNMK